MMTSSLNDHTCTCSVELFTCLWMPKLKYSLLYLKADILFLFHIFLFSLPKSLHIPWISFPLIFLPIFASFTFYFVVLLIFLLVLAVVLILLYYLVFFSAALNPSLHLPLVSSCLHLVTYEQPGLYSQQSHQQQAELPWINLTLHTISIQNWKLQYCYYCEKYFSCLLIDSTFTITGGWYHM